MRSRLVVAQLAFVLGTFGVLIACSGDDEAKGSAEPRDVPVEPDAAGPSDVCASKPALVLSIAPTQTRVGSKVALSAAGGTGIYAFSVAPGGSGGEVDGQSFIAGATPAVDTLKVTDADCHHVTEASLRVVANFEVAPRSAIVRPGAAFDLVVEGVLGKATFALKASETGSSVDAAGHFVAGTKDGIDTLVVHDDGDGAEVTSSIEVRAGAKLVATYPRIALPPGSSVPLVATGGSDTIVWQRISGPGTVQGDRYTASASDAGAAVVRGHDSFTGDEVDLALWSLDAPEPTGQASDALGSSVAVTTKGTSFIAGFGAPTSNSVGRVYGYDGLSSTVKAIVEGAASPLHRGLRVGAGAAFTDFNGDGRQDIVTSALDFVIPRNAVRATEIAPYYAVDRTACVPETSNSKGGVLVSLQQASGEFLPAYRLWRDTATGGDIGSDVAGGFDFNGDGKKDIAIRRTASIEVFLGRAPDDATLAKLTMACDPLFVSTTLPAPVTALTPLGDIDGDGCEDLGAGYRDATHGGIFVVFGYDVGGTRCGGRTQPSTARFSADADSATAYLGLGSSMANVGRFLDGGTKYIAVGASGLSFGGVVRPGIVLFDAAKVAAKRALGPAFVGGISDVTEPGRALTSTEPFDGFGSTVGAGDVNGDGIPDLFVGAPSGSFAAPSSGVVFVFAGGASSTGLMAPYLAISGDDGAPSNFGSSLAVLPGDGLRSTTVVVGSPTSARRGANNGAAFVFAPPL